MAPFQSNTPRNDKQHKISFDAVISALEAQGYNPRSEGDGYSAKCPAHEDRNPSLSVNPKDGGGVLIYCHAGCKYEDILAALNLSPTASARGRRNNGSTPRVAPPSGSRRHKDGTPYTATPYVYHHADGREHFANVRLEPGKDGRSKQYQLWKADPKNGGWLPKAPQEKRSLYRLPAINGNDTVFIVEGEKCADALQTALHNPVTTWAGGAKAWPKTDWEPLAARRVAVIADADEPGRMAARGIAARLHKFGCAVRIALPEGDSGEDVADWINAKGSKGVVDYLEKLLRPYGPKTDKPPPRETAKRQEQERAAADIEAGRIPGNSEFQLGLDLGHDLGRRFLFVKNPQGGEWFEAGSTYWERCVIDEVRQVAHGELLSSHLEKARAEFDGKRADWLISRAWRHPELNAGLRRALAGELPPAPVGAIATPGGIYIPTAAAVGPPRPFDPKRDGFLACTRSIPEDDLKATFSRMVWEWCGEDSELAGWLQRLFGAAAVGKAHRKVINIIGPASCGKSTFTRCLATALGELAMIANERLFDSRGNHNEQLCDLIEKKPRLTFLQETQGKRLDADLLNAISGGDLMKNRRPHGHDVKGTVKTLPVILGEAPFRIAGMTAGTVQRVQVLPFVKPPKTNPDLVTRVGDADSIEAKSAMWWLLEGATQFLRHGFGDTPSAVVQRTDSARADYDPIAAWMMEQTKGGPAAELLGRMRDAGLDPDNRLSAVWIGRKASALGWSATKAPGGQRSLEPPPG